VKVLPTYVNEEICQLGRINITPNVLQLNADFVLHKICDLGAVRYQYF